MAIQPIYLDNATVTRPSEQVVSRMIPFFTEDWGSPSSPHRMGQRLWPAMEEAYRSLYALLGASEQDTILFTSSGTEAINQVLQSVFFDVTRATGKNHFVTSAIDEAPAILTLGHLEQLGAVSKAAAVTKSGHVTSELIGDALTPRTALVSLSWANALTGVVNPVAEIAALCKQRGILFHLDATHVLGKLYFELAEVGADFITFNGDQMHGPKGSGGLYIRKKARLSPLLFGGMQQGGYRGDDVNVPALVGLGQAAREAIESRDLLCTEVARLRNRLEEGVLQAYPEAKLFYRDQERLPNVTTIAFPGVVNEALLFALNRQGLYASMGGGNFQQLGLLLAASGVSELLSHSALSFSLARTNYEEEIDRAISIIADSANKLRILSQHILGAPA